MLLIPLLTVLAACSLQVPADPDGTLDRVTGQTLRAGASVQGDLVTLDDGELSGRLVTLVEEFAETLDATVEWTVGGEESLVAQVSDGELDLVVGDLTDETPWSTDVGVTRGHAVPGTEREALVMLVPPGENRFLTELERFLDDEVE